METDGGLITVQLFQPFILDRLFLKPCKVLHKFSEKQKKINVSENKNVGLEVLLTSDF